MADRTSREQRLEAALRQIVSEMAPEAKMRREMSIAEIKLRALCQQLKVMAEAALWDADNLSKRVEEPADARS